LIITSDGLEYRYLYHHLDSWIKTKLPKDEYGNLDTNGKSLQILECDIENGSLGYNLRCDYLDYNFNLDGFGTNARNIKYLDKLGNPYDECGYYNIKDENGILPYENNSIDILISTSTLDNLQKDIGNIFLSEVKRVSHNAIVLVTNHIWKYKDFKKDRDWKVHAFGLNIPKRRNPTTLDTIVSPWTFGFSKFGFYFWSRTLFATYEGEQYKTVKEKIQ
jgi:hypothetical protein